jgi:hypothetical protein
MSAKNSPRRKRRKKGRKVAPYPFEFRVRVARLSNWENEIARFCPGLKTLFVHPAVHSELVKESGFGEKKIRNILYRLYKLGKIKRRQRGVYIAAGRKETT